MSRQHYHEANRLRDENGDDMPWHVSDAVICMVVVVAILLSIRFSI